MGQKKKKTCECINNKCSNECGQNANNTCNDNIDCLKKETFQINYNNCPSYSIYGGYNEDNTCQQVVQQIYQIIQI